MKLLTRYQTKNNQCHIDFYRMQIIMLDDITDVNLKEDLYIYQNQAIIKFKKELIEDQSTIFQFQKNNVEKINDLETKNIILSAIEVSKKLREKEDGITKDIDIQNYYDSRTITYKLNYPEYIAINYRALRKINDFDLTVENFGINDEYDGLVFYSNIKVDDFAEETFSFTNKGREEVNDPDLILKGVMKKNSETYDYLQNQVPKFSYKYVIKFKELKILSDLKKILLKVTKFITVLLGNKFYHSKPMMFNQTSELRVYYLNYTNELTDNWYESKIESRNLLDNSEKSKPNLSSIYKTLNNSLSENTLNALFNIIVTNMSTNVLLTNYFYILERFFKNEKEFKKIFSFYSKIKFKYVSSKFQIDCNNESVMKYFFWYYKILLTTWRNHFTHASLIEFRLSEDAQKRIINNRDYKKIFNNPVIKLKPSAFFINFYEGFTEETIRNFVIISFYCIIFDYDQDNPLVEYLSFFLTLRNHFINKPNLLKH